MSSISFLGGVEVMAETSGQIGDLITEGLEARIKPEDRMTQLAILKHDVISKYFIDYQSK